MDSNRTSGVVTNSAGDADTNGDLPGSLVERIGTAPDPGRYVERPGLDERIRVTGADVGMVRGLLGVAA